VARRVRLGPAARALRPTSIGFLVCKDLAKETESAITLGLDAGLAESADQAYGIECVWNPVALRLAIWPRC